MIPRGWGRFRTVVAMVSMVSAAATARAEDLNDAWAIAMGVDFRLRSSRLDAMAAGFDLAAARAERMPRLTTFNTPTFLTNGISMPNSSGSHSTAGSPQRTFALSIVAAEVPIYTGGRVRHGIEARSADVGAARADEHTTAEDLRLQVARAYVGVLRSDKAVEVARGNVASLSAQARDVGNLVDLGRAIRNDLLAARVALANARQREIQLRNNLDLAWATYNRWLGRPMDTRASLVDLAPSLPPPRPDDVQAARTVRDPSVRVASATSTGEEPTPKLPAALPASAARSVPPPFSATTWRSPGDGAATTDVPTPHEDESRLQDLMQDATRNRSELTSLGEQARSHHAQAGVQRAASLPQASFYVANLYQNSQFLPSQADSGAASFFVSWTFFDFGRSKRKALAEEQRAASLISRRADVAADISLQVRSAWLNLRETRTRIPVAHEAIAQAEENLRVARSRYIEQRGTNTEVLDAESLRVQAYDNYYNAVYDAATANFELGRAVGNL